MSSTNPMFTAVPQSTALPLATEATPTVVADVASNAATTTENTTTAATPNEFVAMLAQLLSEGAEVLAAPTQSPVKTAAVVDESAATASESESSELVDAMLLADPAIAALFFQDAALGNAASGAADQTDNTAPVSRFFAATAMPQALPKALTDQVNTQLIANAVSTEIGATGFKEQMASVSLAVTREGDGGAQAGGTPEAPQLAGASNTATLTAQAARQVAQLDARVGTPAWSDQLAARVTFLHERGVQSASLRLSPEHLGPMEIQINVQDDRATVWFGAAHADTRAALEQALPRLRELLQAQGLALADAGVFREGSREQARAYLAKDSLLGHSSSDERVVVTVQARSVLLDAYA